MPKAITFNTISTELLEHAELIYRRFDGLGYTVSIEPSNLGYPKTPAMSCHKHHTTIIIEVYTRPDIKTLNSWVALCKSTNHDLRVAVCLPHSNQNKQLAKHQIDFQQLGIGIYVSNGTKVTEICQPKDLSLQIHPPELKDFPKFVRKALGTAYELFERGQWREGFEEACKALEQRARRYLKDSINSGRLTIYDTHGKPKNPTSARIDKMPIGPLAEAFGNASPQNITDSQLYKTLSSINPDRVGVAHKINKIKTEKSLRSNVGVHMHAIVQAFRHMK
jgi:hypothetical protein